MLLPDGGQYEGEFAGDKFEGQGQYLYPDGSVYTGSWAAGAKHGPGGCVAMLCDGAVLAAVKAFSYFYCQRV